jgi:hypothetical protein
MGGTVSFSSSEESDLRVDMFTSTLLFFCEYLEECMASNLVLKNDAKFVYALGWPLRSKDGYLGLSHIETSTLKELARLFQELATDEYPYWENLRKSYSEFEIEAMQNKGIDLEQWFAQLKKDDQIIAAKLAAATEQRVSFLQSKS